MNTGKELIEQLTFCKQLMDRLYIDIMQQVSESNITKNENFYAFPNGCRYEQDSIRLRRELNKLNKIMVYKGEY